MAKSVSASKSTPYREAREACGLSQWQAALQIPTSKSSMNRYELGKSEPPRDVVVRMDEVYGCGGQLIRKWIDAKFSFGAKKKAILTAIKIALRKIFNLARL